MAHFPFFPQLTGYCERMAAGERAGCLGEIIGGFMLNAALSLCRLVGLLLVWVD